MEKPRSAAGYPPEGVEHVRAACLYVATVLGDLLIEELVVVGGLVPSLLITQDPLPEGVPLHAGTMDLDLGLDLGVLDESKYHEIAERLRHAGFEAKRNAEGNTVLQTWTIRGNYGHEVTIDFLIGPASEADQAPGIKHLEPDFGAVITPGLNLAFRDKEIVSIDGITIMGERAKREIPVCGPGAFVILKALAFDSRGAPKDAYDLYYTIRNLGGGVEDVAGRIIGLLPDPEAEKALSILRRDFTSADLVGPLRAAEFSGDADQDVIREDVVGFVDALLLRVDQRAGE